MPLAYNLANVIVSASIEPEAFGRVSIEAQSMEKLIIASNIGGSKETILKDKSGFLFQSGDPISLAEKIKEAMNLDEITLKTIQSTYSRQDWPIQRLFTYSTQAPDELTLSLLQSFHLLQTHLLQLHLH